MVAECLKQCVLCLCVIDGVWRVHEPADFYGSWLPGTSLGSCEIGVWVLLRLLSRCYKSFDLESETPVTYMS
jgi:hypothetical protein